MQTVTFTASAMEHVRIMAETEPAIQKALNILYANRPEGDFVRDPLPGIIDSLFGDMEDTVREYLDENPEKASDEIDLSDINYYGRISELIDGAVPVYTADIEAVWWHHAAEIEEAYENAGIGENPRENYGMAGIYCLLQEKLYEDFDLESVVESWQEQRDDAFEREVMECITNASPSPFDSYDGTDYANEVFEACESYVGSSEDKQDELQARLEQHWETVTNQGESEED